MTLLVSELKKLNIGKEKKEQPKPADDVVVMPTFVPARMKPGEGVLEVTTRQRFLNDGYATWINWHATRVLAILFAVAALFLLAINLWVAAGAGIAAGYFYSDHARTARKISIMYTRRRLLYTR